MQRGDMIYYARIMPSVNTYELLDLKIGSVYQDYFVGVELKTKQRFLFFYSQLQKEVYFTRNIALKKVKEASKNRKTGQEETYYEEY